MEEQHVTLGDIVNMEVGQLIELQATPRSPVKLECNKQPIFTCRLERLDGAYTLQVEDLIYQNENLLDDLLSR
ncbi:FliM/FliN family flagellar motor C-terminal domain-containing protein [Breoghania sp.]|uniref:FliM/FliN family flagellar motor C-terminal domain-containing protein n=1 Tax=Breoghania sp. TaxID=2065378 RepID=UPI0032048EA8